MIVDEMELLGRLKDVEPLPPEAFEHARLVLRGAMADARPDSVESLVFGQDLAQSRRRPRRRTLITHGKIGLGLGAAVVATAVALVIVSTAQPAANSGRPQAVSPSAPASAQAKPSTEAKAPAQAMPSAEAKASAQAMPSAEAKASAQAKPSAEAKAPPQAKPSAETKASAQAKPSPGSPSASPVVNSPLMSVAAFVKANAAPPAGNATLVIRTQADGSNPPEVDYDLYADSGDYYWAMTESGLPQAIADHENRANGVDVREVAAALYAANGDLATARVRMINASASPFGLGGTPAQKKENSRLQREGIKASGPDKGKALQEDYDVWNNSMDALTEGAGNPQVRVGVLRLLSTVPEVTVNNSTTGGQPTLTLTAGTALFGGITQQVLTISTRTGMPISTATNVAGQKPSSVVNVNYQVSRVTLADIAAGKF